MLRPLRSLCSITHQPIIFVHINTRPISLSVLTALPCTSISTLQHGMAVLQCLNTFKTSMMLTLQFHCNTSVSQHLAWPLKALISTPSHLYWWTQCFDRPALRRLNNTTPTTHHIDFNTSKPQYLAASSIHSSTPYLFHVVSSLHIKMSNLAHLQLQLLPTCDATSCIYRTCPTCQQPPIVLFLSSFSFWEQR